MLPLRSLRLQVKAAALAGSLQRDLAPIYFISGDETLLVEEACDTILSAAAAQGFEERSVLHAETGFRWHDVTQDAASMSLFASRRIIDLRVPTGKFDREASEVLRAYAARPLDDTVLLIRTRRLEAKQRSTAWFKQLDAAGVVVLIWPVGAAELPRWLESRLKSAGLRMDREAMQYFCERVEGNLLAAVQEIGKLKLSDLPQPIDSETLATVLEDAAHYDTFELLDAVYGGDAARVARMVVGLRAEGVAPFAILGALTAQLRRFARGDRMPPQRQRVAQQFLARLGRGGVDRVLAQCALIDQQGKGQLLGDAWLSLESLLVRLAGARVASLEQQLPYLIR
jgi:DNA polymerase-3 subunit delta